MLSKNPLPIPLEKLGVKDSQFAHLSKLHGAGHVNRVIFNAMTLCRSMGWGDKMMPEVWAAAYLHDLARRHDGPCEQHGVWAMNEKLPALKKFLSTAGVKDWDAVNTAVCMHAATVELGRDHPHYRITALLKDADALDRFRLGDLDPSRLRLPRSPQIMPYCKRLFERTTAQSADWVRTWELGVEIFNPHLNASASIVDRWDPDEAGVQRRNRRLSQAQFADRMDEFLALAADAEHVSRVKSKEWPMNVFTYCSQETLDAFKESGEWLDYWSLQDRGIKAWHDRYSDRPEDAKAYNDIRLWGEKGRGICYAIITPSAMPYDGSGPDQWARGTYGPVRIQWDERVMDEASFTLNDSQECVFAIPFSAPNLLWAVRASSRFNFIEAQIHRPMKPTDIKEVT